MKSDTPFNRLMSRRSWRHTIPTLALWLVLLSSLAGLIREGGLWLEARRYHAQRVQPERIDNRASTHTGLLVARAEYLERTGQRQEARAIYDMLLHRSGTEVKVLAHYKLGTLDLAEAAPIWHAVGVLEYSRVNTLVALAKEHLRAALRLQPDHWEARYNLEYAERITPPPREQDKAKWQGSKSSLFATLPSLPGGAP